jgi:hypothetical protein
MAQVRLLFQAQCLKALFSTFCGPEPWAGLADCAAHCASSLTSLATEKRRCAWKRFGYNVIRRLLGFYPIPQSSNVPIVWFDAMSRLLLALWSSILNSMIGSRFCALKIDLETGPHSTTSVVALPANENLTGGRWRSFARAMANMNCAVRLKTAIHGRIFGSLQRRRWFLT